MRQPVQAQGHALDHAGLLAGGLGVALGLDLAFSIGGEARGLGLGFQPHLLLGVLPEGQDGVGHTADLVVTADRRDGDVQIAAGQTAHGAGHGLHRAAQGADQPQGRRHGDAQRQHPADGEGDVGLGEGGGLSLGARLGLNGLLLADRTDRLANVGQARRRGDLGQGGALGRRIARQGHDVRGALFKGGGGGDQALLLAGVGALDVGRSQVRHPRLHIGAALVEGLDEAGVAIGDVTAHGVLLLDGGGHQTVRRLHHLARGQVRRIGALQGRHAPQNDQGGRPARRDHRHEGQDQLLGDGQVLQHDFKARGGRFSTAPNLRLFAKC
ncbi:hypothetical protein D3C73_981570 [compost metagenome]